MFMLRLDELIVALRERDSKRKSAAVTNSTALGLGRTRRDLRDINFRVEQLHPRISFSSGAASSSDFIFEGSIISDGEDS